MLTTTNAGMPPAIRLGTAAFLEALWPESTPGFLNIWSLPDKLTRSHHLADGFEPVAKSVLDLSHAGKAVYVQMGLQPTPTGPHSRGTAATTCAIPGLWFDLDIAGPGHKEPALPPDLTVALDLVFSLPLKPSLIVHSGGGVYPFWLFNNPWVFANDDDRLTAKALSVAWQSLINENGRARGYRLDSTANLDRLLRIPGSINNKVPDDPRPVQVIYFDPAVRYDREDIEHALASTAPKPIISQKAINPTGAALELKKSEKDYPPADFDKVMEGCAWLRHCRDDAATLAQPEWYAAIGIVARCVDGANQAHAISRPYPGYTEAETDKKIENALKNAGPRTCKTIRASLGGEPFCATCPNRGKVHSPIVLGHVSGQAVVPEFLEGLLPDAPVPPGIVTPRGYRVSYEKGVVKLESEGKGKVKEILVIPSPVFIANRSHDVGAGTEFLEVAWFRDKRWNTRIVPRRVVADTREIMALCDFGLPVNSLRSAEVVGYFDAFEIANERTIPLIKSSASLGWQLDEAFLWGESLLTMAEKSDGGQVAFRPQDAGDGQVAKAFHSRGDLEAWTTLVNGIYCFSKVIVMVMAALSTPFLRILEATNFIIDLAGETSKGKTTVLHLCAAAWGNPDARSQASTMHTWDATDVWLERTAALLNGLPLILDDTKTARSKEVIGDFIYRFAFGKGKGRATLAGTRETGAWKSILISTGEQCAVDYAKGHGGANARVLSLWGAPFGDGDHASFVQNLNMTAKANYGHAGPRVVQFVLDHQDDWPLWRKAYREMTDHYAAKASGGGGVATRISEIFAVLATTTPLIHAALPELKPSRPIADILEELWPSVMHGAQQADLATEAVKALWEWAVANQSKFWGRAGESENQAYEPNRGWAGRWDAGPGWPFLAFTSVTIDDVLGRDFEVKAMVKTWADRGWLARDAKKRGHQRTMRIAGSATSLYAFPRSTLTKVLEIDLDALDKKLGPDLMTL